MQLEIRGDSKLINKKFGKWVLPKIKLQLINSIDKNKLKRWDKYFNSSTDYQRIDNKNISSYDILIQSISHLTYYDSSDLLIIKFPPNRYLPNYNLIKIESICKLINFGNMEVKGYPVITDTFNIIAECMQEYITEYIEEYW